MVQTAVGPVEFAETGTGPALLIVHGMPGDWSQAQTLAGDLATRHRVVLPSRPGYGRTPLTTGRSPREQAAAHAALLDHLGIDQVAVVGISAGGPSARALVAHDRLRCTHLVLCCPLAEHLVTVPLSNRVLAAVPGLWELGAHLAAWRVRRGLTDPRATLVRALAELGPAEQAVATDDPQVHQDLLAFAEHRARVMTSVAGLRNDFRWFGEITTPDPWPVGPAVPTLVLHGDGDQVVPLAHGHYYGDSIPGAQLEVLAGTGHAFPLALRTATSTRIDTFLEFS